MVKTNFENIDLNNIQGVLLDLDNTLYAYDPCHEAAYKACEHFAWNKNSITPDEFKRTWKEARDIVHQQLHGQGASHSRLLYFHKQYEALYKRSNPLYALDQEQVYWNAFLDAMVLKSEAISFLQKLKAKGLKSSLVTDLTTQIQMQKWEYLKLGDYIDFLVSSEEAGQEKPASTIFELALNKMNMMPNDVIMIGDHPEKDIKGAEKLGIKAYLIQD